MEKIGEIEEIKLHLQQITKGAGNLYFLMEELKEIQRISSGDKTLVPILSDFEKVGFFFMQYVDIKIDGCLSELQIENYDHSLRRVTMKLYEQINVECDAKELMDFRVLKSYFYSHKYLFCLKCRESNILDRTKLDMFNSCVSSMISTMSALDELEKYIEMI